MCRDTHQVWQAKRNEFRFRQRECHSALVWDPAVERRGQHYTCFTLLLNLHDFVTEPFNLAHIFRDAHTVPFCLTADHISSQHSFGLLWTRGEWKV